MSEHCGCKEIGGLGADGEWYISVDHSDCRYPAALEAIGRLREFIKVETYSPALGRYPSSTTAILKETEQWVK